MLLGGSLGIPLSVLATARLLIKIMTRSSPGQKACTSMSERISSALCTVIPAVVMASQLSFAPSKYAISSSGCEATFIPSLPAYMMLFIWQLAFATTAFGTAGDNQSFLLRVYI